MEKIRVLLKNKKIAYVAKTAAIVITASILGLIQMCIRDRNGTCDCNS